MFISGMLQVEQNFSQDSKLGRFMENGNYGTKLLEIS